MSKLLKDCRAGLQQGLEIFKVWHLFGNSTTHWSMWYVGLSHKGHYTDARRCRKAAQRSHWHDWSSVRHNWFR
jgi:hypothetical protein